MFFRLCRRVKHSATLHIKGKCTKEFFLTGKTLCGFELQGFFC